MALLTLPYFFFMIKACIKYNFQFSEQGTFFLSKVKFEYFPNDLTISLKKSEKSKQAERPQSYVKGALKPGNCPRLPMSTALLRYPARAWKCISMYLTCMAHNDGLFTIELFSILFYYIADSSSLHGQKHRQRKRKRIVNQLEDFETEAVKIQKMCVYK